MRQTILLIYSFYGQDFEGCNLMIPIVIQEKLRHFWTDTIPSGWGLGQRENLYCGTVGSQIQGNYEEG